MKIRAYFVFLCLFLICNTGFSQLSLINEPDQGAFLAQDPNTGKALLQFSGSVDDSQYSKLFIKVFQSNKLLSNIAYNLKFTNGKSDFNLKTYLAAGKFFYRLEFELIGKDTVKKKIDGIIVGDVYIIQGQSNAAANSYSTYDNNYLDTFLRSFGTCDRAPWKMITDLDWHPINPIRTYQQGSVGQWAGVMAKQLLDSFGIPICLMNGAVGGTRITLHQPTIGDHEDVANIYGRLLFRVKAAKLDKKIRGILYYQGESDGSNANLHDSLFRKLVGYWKKDFPGYKKLYVIQVRDGCGNPSMQLRDVQRKFQSMNSTQVVSANGLNGHDNCHFKFKNGYEDLGIQMAAILGRDFYNSGRTNVDPPNISKCYFSNSKETEITLEMMNPLDSVFVDPNFQSLFRIEGDPGVTITGGSLRGNKVVLSLDKSSCSKLGLTYNGLRGVQPWVKNATKMGLISFYNIPIERKPVRRIYQMCRRGSVVLSVDSISGCSYTWLRRTNNKGYLGSKVLHQSDSNEIYTLNVNYDTSVCKITDSYSIFVNVDPIEIPNLQNDTVLCHGDSITLEPNNDYYASFNWLKKDTRIESEKIVINKMEFVRLTATSNMGCRYYDSIDVRFSQPIIKLPKDIILCPGKDTLISVPNNFKSYLWNNTLNGTNSFLVKKGKLSLMVQDSFNCSAVDSSIIMGHKSVYQSFQVKSLCKNTVLPLSKPDGIVKWWNDGTKLKDNINVFPNSTTPFSFVDSNSCYYYDTLSVMELSLPVFSLGKDTGFCSNLSIVLNAPIGNYSYKWNEVETNSNQSMVNKAGVYTAMVIDENKCSFIDTIAIEEYPVPTLDLFKDTTLCDDKYWRVTPGTGVLYRVNNTIIKGSYLFDTPGLFSISSENMQGCLAEKDIVIKFKDCTVSISNIDVENGVTLYPNPIEEDYLIVANNSTFRKAELLDARGRSLMVLALSSKDNRIDFQAFAKGIYYLKVGAKYTKVVKN